MRGLSDLPMDVQMHAAFNLYVHETGLTSGVARQRWDAMPADERSRWHETALQRAAEYEAMTDEERAEEDARTRAITLLNNDVNYALT